MNARGRLLGDPFYITVSPTSFIKGEIIHTGDGKLLKVIKTYRLTWWRKILKWLGFKIKNPNTYKVVYFGQKLL